MRKVGQHHLIQNPPFQTGTRDPENDRPHSGHTGRQRPATRLQKSEPDREAKSGTPLIPRRRPLRRGFWETGSEALAFPYTLA